MAEKQVTTMVIKVDLDCEKCAKKIKKVLCKIPQIQNQIYDKKANTVTITVVCCSPEKIKQKICCKGGETIKGIEIKVAEKPKATTPQPAPQPAPQPTPKPAPQPVSQPTPPPIPTAVIPEPTNRPGPEPAQIPIPRPVPKPMPPPKSPERVPACPPTVPVYPPRTCCRECYEGGYGGPCFHGYGTPAPPPWYDPAYGRPVYDRWGGGGCTCRRSGYYVCRCEYVVCDDNRSSCIIM